MPSAELATKLITYDTLSSGGGKGLDLIQAGLAAHRSGLLAGDFKTVVAGGIMTGGNLGPTTGIEMIDGKIQQRRIDHAYIYTIHPAAKGTVDKRCG